MSSRGVIDPDTFARERERDANDSSRAIVRNLSCLRRSIYTRIPKRIYNHQVFSCFPDFSGHPGWHSVCRVLRARPRFRYAHTGRSRQHGGAAQFRPPRHAASRRASQPIATKAIKAVAKSPSLDDRSRSPRVSPLPSPLPPRGFTVPRFVTFSPLLHEVSPRAVNPPLSLSLFLPFSSSLFLSSASLSAPISPSARLTFFDRRRRRRHHRHPLSSSPSQPQQQPSLSLSRQRHHCCIGKICVCVSG